MDVFETQVPSAMTLLTTISYCVEELKRTHHIGTNENFLKPMRIFSQRHDINTDHLLFNL